MFALETLRIEKFAVFALSNDTFNFTLISESIDHGIKVVVSFV